MLFFNNFENELRKMREKHEHKLEKMKLQSELNIESNKLNNELVLDSLNAENNQLEVKSKIFDLKNIVNKDNLTIKVGKSLKFWAIIVTIISTLLTIAGGYKDFRDSYLTTIAFISSVIVLQFTVYFISSQETRIKQDFSRHFNKVITLKYCLLSISIYNNYRFFEPSCNTIISKLVVFILCIALDLIAIFMVSLAYDQITLNKYKEHKNEIETSKNDDKSIFYKIFYNLCYGFVSKINRKYMENCNNSEMIDITNYDKIDNTNLLEVSKTQDKKLLSSTFDDKLLKDYVNYIFDNKSNNNIANGYKSVAMALGIDRKVAEEIKKYLDSVNITKVEGKKTKIVMPKNKALEVLA